MFGFLIGATIFRWSWSTLAFGWSIHSEEGASKRAGLHPSGGGAWYQAPATLAGCTMAHVALESTTHPVESMCVSTLEKEGRWRVGKLPTRMCVGQTQRIRARALPATPPRYERSTSGASVPQDQDDPSSWPPWKYSKAQDCWGFLSIASSLSGKDINLEAMSSLLSSPSDQQQPIWW